MADPDEDELGSRCIFCGEPFTAHEGDWCSSQEEAENMIPVVRKVIPFRMPAKKKPPGGAAR
jgi:hypothetical protein